MISECFAQSCVKPTSLSPALPQRPRGHAHTEGLHISFDVVLPFDGNQQTVPDSAGAAVLVCLAFMLMRPQPGGECSCNSGGKALPLRELAPSWWPCKTTNCLPPIMQNCGLLCNREADYWLQLRTVLLWNHFSSVGRGLTTSASDSSTRETLGLW